jgi:hypothetical protein
MGVSLSCKDKIEIGSGVRSQESGVRSQELGVRNFVFFLPCTPAPLHPRTPAPLHFSLRGEGWKLPSRNDFSVSMYRRSHTLRKIPRGAILYLLSYKLDSNPLLVMIPLRTSLKQRTTSLSAELHRQVTRIKRR